MEVIRTRFFTGFSSTTCLLLKITVAKYLPQANTLFPVTNKVSHIAHCC